VRRRRQWWDWLEGGWYVLHGAVGGMYADVLISAGVWGGGNVEFS
jgi:hypothetical protein